MCAAAAVLAELLCLQVLHVPVPQLIKPSCCLIRLGRSPLELLPHLLESRANDLGGLELQCIIGRGSFGTVYKGLRPHSLHEPL